MKRFDLKQHNAKMFEISKSAARGVYPSKHVAKIGSIIGTVIGMALALIGMVGLVLGSIWGIGSLFAGVITVVSNIINLKRIK